MEATHLGALFCKRSVQELDSAIDLLKTVPKLPSNVADLVKSDGTIDPVIAAALHGWLAPAFRIFQAFSSGDLGESLGVPTWLYGYEPTTPFAAYSGKYFQNSLREDGLVTLGAIGIVYAEGNAGTPRDFPGCGSKLLWHYLSNGVSEFTRRTRQALLGRTAASAASY